MPIPSYYDNAERHDGAPDYRELSALWVVARKEHACAFCRRPILPGTRYWRIARVVDGVFGVDKTHSATGMCGLDEECEECR
jgi:hypothetical protein